MAKKKSSKKVAWQSGFGKARLLPELQRAEALIVREKWDEAKQTLENLHQSYPSNPDVLILLVNVYLDLNDIPGYTSACERLLKVDPANADAAYGLAGGYLSTMHPFLAVQAFHHALDRFPNHEKAADSKKLVLSLEPKLAETLAEMELAGEEGKAIALLHERGQACMERGDYRQARQAEEEVLKLKPNFSSALNNLCLIAYCEGNVDQAIAAAKQVLEQQPDNIHALSNLIHFYCARGEQEQAQPLAEQLKASEAKGWDPWTKKAEGLSYLGDDAGVLSLFEQAKKADDFGITTAMFHHLVAVAMERSGQSKQARQQWKKALEKSPGFTLAQANLEDLKLPVGRRHGPWAFELNAWLNHSDVVDLTASLQSVTKSKNDDLMATAIQRYLSKHPHIVRLIPILLKLGDPPGREFALRSAIAADSPEMLAILKDFALSQSGPDELRHQAATKVSDAGLFPSETVRMWLQGEWRDIMLIAFEFHETPPYKHSKKVETLLRQALPLLHQRTKTAAESAEQLLKQAIELEPDAPDLLNNLAAAYELQERRDESRSLMQEIFERFPDYVHGRVAVARLHIHQGDLEAAEALIKPMLSYKKFHIDDFGVFSSAYIELSVAQGRLEVAESWLKMWEGVDPDHAELKNWQTRLAAPTLLKKFSKLLK